MAECPFEIGKGKSKACFCCGEPLPPRRQRWCSDKCATRYWENHMWGVARDAALKRDRGCVKCGVTVEEMNARFSAALKAEREKPGRERNLRALEAQHRFEVNHIEPRYGRGYHNGCWNHLENLETLCHPCHVAVTNQQRKEREGEPRRRFWVARWSLDWRRRLRQIAVCRNEEVFMTLAAAVASTADLPPVDHGERRFAPVMLRLSEIEQRGPYLYSLVQRREPEMPFATPEAFALVEGAS